MIIHLTGDKLVSIDSKYRVRFPGEMRKLLPESFDGRFIIRKNIKTGSLQIYPVFLWIKSIDEEIRRLDVQVEEELEVIQLLNHGTDFAELDAEGVRITIGQEMLRFAGIADEGRLVGNKYFFGLWNPEKFAQHIEELESRRNMIMEVYREKKAGTDTHGGRPPVS